MENETLKIGIKRLVYNKTMREARLKLGLSQKDLGDKVGIHCQSIGKIEIFKDIPTVNQAHDIAEVLDSTPEVLFPTHLYAHLKEKLKNVPRDFSIDVTPVMLSSHESMGLLTSGNEEVDVKLDAEMQLKKFLPKLKDREKRVISLRFGLEDDKTRTLEEVGKEFGVSRDRIRQIEQKALKTLKYYISGEDKLKYKIYKAPKKKSLFFN